MDIDHTCEVQAELLDRFAPCSDVARRLLPYVSGSSGDGSHDLTHILRVWSNVRAIQHHEGGCLTCLAAATILHDCVQVEKNSADRPNASRQSALRAREILNGLAWPMERIESVAHAIEAHSFAADIAPVTTEAAVLQDADRLDAIGHVGIARCFYVAGRLGSSLYDVTDPSAARRALDDGQFALDHFRKKLLGLSSGFHTRTGARMAQERHQRLERFLTGFLSEIGANDDKESRLGS